MKYFLVIDKDTRDFHVLAANDSVKAEAMVSESGIKAFHVIELTEYSFSKEQWLVSGRISTK